MASPSDKAKEVIEDVAEHADNAISSSASKASNATRRAKTTAQDFVDDGTDVLEGALICAKNMVRANPIASVAIVAALAYLCGRMK